MLTRSSSIRGGLALAMLIGGYSQASLADTLDLNYAATSPDGTTVTHTIVNPTINVPAPTSQSTYTRSLPPLNFTIPATGFEFYDDYIFTIDGSNVSSITATIDLGNTFNLSDLNVRLFSWNGKDEQLNGTVTLGTVGLNLIQAWTYATGTGEVAVIDQDSLAAGTYVLQVRGNVTGALGGAYVGSLNLTPVPLPATLPLLVWGLGAFGLSFGRRRLAA